MEEERNEKLDALIESLTYFDNDFMTLALDNNHSVIEYIFKTITDITIKVKTTMTEKRIKERYKGRGIRLDTLAIDEHSNHINIEFQNSPFEFPIQRARYYSSLLDLFILNGGDQYELLTDGYTIFFCEKDVFKDGRALHWIKGYDSTTCLEYIDGRNIIFVNGEYKEENSIGQLLRDLQCKNYHDIQNKELKETMRYYKEGEGKKAMCDKVRAYVEEAAKEAAEVMAKDMVEEAAEEGRAEGQQDKELQYLKKYLSKGFNDDEIKDFMEIDQDKLIQLKSLLKDCFDNFSCFIE